MSSRPVKVVGMVAPKGSGIIEVLESVSEELKKNGKDVMIIDNVMKLLTAKFDKHDYVIIKYHLNTWKDIERLTKIFDPSSLRLFTHVPIWKGITKRGSVEMIDANWSAWCIYNNVVNSNETVKGAKLTIGDTFYSIPKIIKQYKVISIANQDIVNLDDCVHVRGATLDQLKEKHEIIDKLNPTNEQMKQMIMVSI